MGGLLTLIGAAGFIGCIIWLIVCIRNWDSKIPPVIGMPEHGYAFRRADVGGGNRTANGAETGQ